MSEKLGPLPKPFFFRLLTIKNAGYERPLFTEKQMRAYAAQEVAKERERLASMLDKAAADYMANATNNKFLTDHGRAIMTSASEWAECMAQSFRENVASTAEPQ